MRTPYKPEPAFSSSARADIAHRDDGSEVTLVACGPTTRRDAVWLVSHFVDSDGRTTWLSQHTHPWTARGEAAARAEFARLTATSAATVTA